MVPTAAGCMDVADGSQAGVSVNGRNKNSSSGNLETGEVLCYPRDFDMIYIKTQVFRLLRYYSPAPRNIARSDWVTQTSHTT